MLDAELTLTGPQGPIRGEPSPRGTGGIPLLDVRHTLISPRDVSTGQPSGKRRHAPITIVKEIDRASPQIAQAWTRNDVLTAWRLDAYGTDRFGRREKVYTIELRRAYVVEIALVTTESGLLTEAVAFAYEGITWTWLAGNVEAHDDWIAPT